MDLAGLIGGIGLPGVWLAAVVDGEAAATLGGILAHRGFYRFETMALTVAAGAMTADNLLFAAGRLSGRFAFVRRLLERPRAAAFGARIEARPVPSVVLARFFYGLHGVATVVLGANRVRWPVFAAVNAVAVLVWAHAWTLAGYAAGTAIERLFGRLPLHHHLLLGLIVAAEVIAVGIFLALRGRSRP